MSWWYGVSKLWHQERQSQPGLLPSVVLEWITGTLDDTVTSKHQTPLLIKTTTAEDGRLGLELQLRQKDRIWNGLWVCICMCARLCLSACGHNCVGTLTGIMKVLEDVRMTTSWQVDSQHIKQIWQEFNYKTHHLSPRCKRMSVFLLSGSSKNLILGC